MSNYDEDQSMELEALQSIYPSELKVLSDIIPREYELIVKTSMDNDETDDDNNISCMLVIRLPADYPAVPCEIVVHSHRNIANDMIFEIQQYVNKLALECSDSESVAIFTIYSAVQEWLQEHGKQAKSASVNDIKATSTTATASDVDADGALQSTVIKQASPLGIEAGTIVTLESFTAWKHLFDAERERIRASQTSASQRQQQQKLSGKQLFMQNIAADVADDEAESMPLESTTAGGTAAEQGKAGVTYFNESLFDDDENVDDEELPESSEDEAV